METGMRGGFVAGDEQRHGLVAHFLVAQMFAGMVGVFGEDQHGKEIAFVFWILTALWCLLMHIDTNRTVYLVLMWIAFAIGLGTLEMMIVFPVIAAAYTFVRARPYFRKVLWLAC